MEAAIMDGARRAARAFLERRDFEVLEEGWAHGGERVDLIAREDGDMVFVDVVADDRGPDMPEERPDRGRFERLAQRLHCQRKPCGRSRRSNDLHGHAQYAASDSHLVRMGMEDATCG